MAQWSVEHILHSCNISDDDNRSVQQLPNESSSSLALPIPAFLPFSTTPLMRREKQVIVVVGDRLRASLLEQLNMKGRQKTAARIIWEENSWWEQCEKKRKRKGKIRLKIGEKMLWKGFFFRDELMMMKICVCVYEPRKVRVFQFFSLAAVAFLFYPLVT